MRDFIFALIGTCLLVSTTTLGGCADSTPPSSGTPASPYTKLAPTTGGGLFRFHDTKEGNVCYIYHPYRLSDPAALSCVPRRHV